VSTPLASGTAPPSETPTTLAASHRRTRFRISRKPSITPTPTTRRVRSCSKPTRFGRQVALPTRRQWGRASRNPFPIRWGWGRHPHQSPFPNSLGLGDSSNQTRSHRCRGRHDDLVQFETTGLTAKPKKSDPKPGKRPTSTPRRDTLLSMTTPPAMYETNTTTGTKSPGRPPSAEFSHQPASRDYGPHGNLASSPIVGGNKFEYDYDEFRPPDRKNVGTTAARCSNTITRVTTSPIDCTPVDDSCVSTYPRFDCLDRNMTAVVELSRHGPPRPKCRRSRLTSSTMPTIACFLSASSTAPPTSATTTSRARVATLSCRRDRARSCQT